MEIIEDTSRLPKELLVTPDRTRGHQERRERLEELIQSQRLSAIAIYKGVYLSDIPASLIKQRK
ncbi:hypothetical protein R0I01_15870 [Bacillus pumilus]|nr:hypothetical protein R0I01_15870 [Bacillus pumilus]